MIGFATCGPAAYAIWLAHNELSTTNQRRTSMNNIAPQPPQTAIPAAVARVEALVTALEDRAQALGLRLASVLSAPYPPSPSTKAQTDGNDVALARELHDLSDRIESVIEQHLDIINRLHV